MRPLLRQARRSADAQQQQADRDLEPVHEADDLVAHRTGDVRRPRRQVDPEDSGEPSDYRICSRMIRPKYTRWPRHGFAAKLDRCPRSEHLYQSAILNGGAEEFGTIFIAAHPSDPADASSRASAEDWMAPGSASSVRTL